ncbi:MAG TPA: hypothetical protein VE152_06055, partial [Acidimicrobiales bacterium]|nr:hypothetical protein [Acidimicrobiales bacterium]
PVATVYLAASSAAAEDAPSRLSLRWRSLRTDLETQGADERALAAIDERLSQERPGGLDETGRVLVASEAGVLLDESAATALVAGDQSRWSRPPYLSPFVRHRARTCVALVAVADHQGAELRVVEVTPEDRPNPVAGERVETDGAAPKPRGQALSHRHIQQRAENAAHESAEKIAQRLARMVAETEPTVVVLAGEVQARTAIHHQAPPTVAERVVEAEGGGRGEGVSNGDLDGEIQDIASRVLKERTERTMEAFGTRRAHGRAVEGLHAVATAASLGAIDTLLLEDGAERRQLWSGIAPEEIGVQEPDGRRAESVDAASALLRACATTDTEVEGLPAGAGFTDNVGALLRFPLPS